MFHRCSGPVARIIIASVLIATTIYVCFHRDVLQTTRIRFDSVLGDVYGYSAQTIAPEESVKTSQDVDAGGEHGVDKGLLTFWKSLSHALRDAQPRISQPIKPSRAHAEQNFNEAYPDLVHEELITTSERDKKRLRVSHSVMVKHIDGIAKKLPYRRKSRGIVTTAGEKYIGPLLVSLRMLRRVGSKLPVEAFFDERTIVTDRVCNGLLKKLEVECRFFGDILDFETMKELRSFQLKIFALLFSSFEDILFLDADAFPVRDPDRLLEVEPFASRGLVTWPDFWSTTTSPTFWLAAGVNEEVVAREQNARASSESGILLVNKNKHARTLLLAAYYNYYGPAVYYPLLSQGAQGQGDKEAFVHAATVLNAPFYAIHAGVHVVGDFFNDKWETSGMKQADPVEDFEKNANTITKATARPMFVHHNIIKLYPGKVFEHILVKAGRDGKPSRLWGLKQSTIDAFGRDLEGEVWEELAKIACLTPSEFCTKAEERLEAVYMD